MTVNQYIGKAYAIRHQQKLRAAMSSDNPFHAQHVQEFCDYTDAVVAAAVESLREAIPAMIQAELSKPSV